MLKLQYFGHLMRTDDSLEKSLSAWLQAKHSDGENGAEREASTQNWEILANEHAALVIYPWAPGRNREKSAEKLQLGWVRVRGLLLAREA